MDVVPFIVCVSFIFAAWKIYIRLFDKYINIQKIFFLETGQKQACKLLNLQAHKLTSWQSYNIDDLDDDVKQNKHNDYLVKMCPFSKGTI